MNNPYFLASLILIGQFATAFLVNFLNQKGKNLADKGDIEKLTEIVEEVRNRFSSENEHLKAGLSILVDKRTKSFTQEQQAIITFYTEINAWIWEKTKISIHEYWINDVEKLNQKIIDMNQAYNNVHIYNGVMDLLVDDDSLTKAADELIIEVLKMHQFVEERCSSLKSALMGLNVHFPSISKFEELHPAMKDFVKSQIKNYESTKDDAIKDFYAMRGEYFKPVFLKLQGFKKLAKFYLRN